MNLYYQANGDSGAADPFQFLKSSICSLFTKHLELISLLIKMQCIRKSCSCDETRVNYKWDIVMCDH